MDKRLSRRLDKIEKKLEPEKGPWLKLPDGKGGFIEVPGCCTWIDMVAKYVVKKSGKRLDETERK